MNNHFWIFNLCEIIGDMSLVPISNNLNDNLNIISRIIFIIIIFAILARKINLFLIFLCFLLIIIFIGLIMHSSNQKENYKEDFSCNKTCNLSPVNYSTENFEPKPTLTPIKYSEENLENLQDLEDFENLENFEDEFVEEFVDFYPQNDYQYTEQFESLFPVYGQYMTRTNLLPGDEDALRCMAGKNQAVSFHNNSIHQYETGFRNNLISNYGRKLDRENFRFTHGSQAHNFDPYRR
jgi:hypothetical protein